MASQKPYRPPYKEWSEYSKEERVTVLRELKETITEGNFFEQAAKLLKATPGQVAGVWHRSRNKPAQPVPAQKVPKVVTSEAFPRPLKLAATEAKQCQYRDCAFEAVPGTKPRRCKHHLNM